MEQSGKRDLRAFMRESAKTEEIVTAVGPATILGEDGKPIMLEIRVLRDDTLQRINEAYRKKTIATDKKGNPYIANGEVAFKVERDHLRASRHIIAEALVHPNLKDPELMAYFDCHDITEMPLKVFSRAEYKHVNRAVTAALGLAGEPAEDETDGELEEAKN